MSKKHEPDNFEQMSIFGIMNLLDNTENTLSSDDISKIIDKLSDAKRKRESIEAKKRRQEEREKREREAREAKERKEAHIREVTSMDLPLDWENVFNQDVRTQGVHADSISDGLMYSLSNLGRVDIEYISSITGEDYKTIICALKGSIYQNPETWGECFYKGWETSEEYLSGNMIRKWKAAKEADKEYNGYFAENIKAIEKVIPPTVATNDIYITLGSPWVPADVIDDFIEYLLGDWRRHWYSINDEKDFHTKHDELTGTWEIPFKSRCNHDVKVTRTYGTDRINALHILERTLNMKSVAVTDEVVCNTNSSGKKRVINQSETILAIEKQNKMIKAFQKWVWEDDARKERLERIFENNFSCIRRRIFDGSFLRFPDMSAQINLYPYQKDAVARIIFTPNTLLAHDVGAGKTYVMIAAAMEMRRMGLSEKNMFVVPNNIVGQWKNIFHEMYPSADILCVDPKSFAPSKRESVLERIRDNDFDGIIIAYSCFEQIPLSKGYYQNLLIDEQKHIAEIAGKKNKATSRLKKKQEAVSKALSELSVAMDDLYNGVYLDDLGITRLFVDEAHNFKKVYIYRYITEGSFDAYSWQLLETKQRFISELLSGSLTERSGTDIADTVLDYAEVKALAVGNPLVKQRVEAANELTRYMALQSKLVESRIRLEKELLEMLGQIHNQIDLIEYCKQDLAFYTEWRKINPPVEDSKLKKEEAEKRKTLREFIGTAIREHVLETKEKTLTSYRGFDIVLPANMTLEKPYVWLKKSGKYYVELGDTDIGNLIRIDNYLDSLEDHLSKLMLNLEKLREKEKDIRFELSKDESYTDQIETYKNKVKKLDKKLGVDKK